MQVAVKVFWWTWQHKWSLLSLIITIGTQVVSRAIVNHFYFRGLWVYRSELHFKLAQTHAAFALVAILLGILAILREKPQWVGVLTLILASLNILGTAV